MFLQCINKKFLFILVGCALGGLIHAQGNSLEEMMNAAKQKMDAKDYSGAYDEYDQILQKRNSYKAALYGKINALYFMKKIKEALELTDKSIDSNPTNAELYFMRGLLYNVREKYEKAIDDFNKCYSIDSTVHTFDVYLNRGVAQLNLPEWESALHDFNAAVRLDPENASAYHSRGLVNYNMGNFQDAVNDFDKSLELNADNNVTYYNLGMTYFRMDKIENACINFHKACSMGNDNACKMVIMQCEGKH